MVSDQQRKLDVWYNTYFSNSRILLYLSDNRTTNEDPQTNVFGQKSPVSLCATTRRWADADPLTVRQWGRERNYYCNSQFCDLSNMHLGYFAAGAEIGYGTVLQVFLCLTKTRLWVLDYGTSAEQWRYVPCIILYTSIQYCVIWRRRWTDGKRIMRRWTDEIIHTKPPFRDWVASAHRYFFPGRDEGKTYLHGSFKFEILLQQNKTYHNSKVIVTANHKRKKKQVLKIIRINQEEQDSYILLGSVHRERRV